MSLKSVVDLQGVREADLEGGNILPGKYHARVGAVSEDLDNRTPCYQIEMTILAGTEPSQVGRVHNEKLWVTDKTKARVARFAHRLGLIGTTDFGQRPEVDWERAVGREVIIELIEETYRKDGESTDRKSTKMSFAGIWELTDQRVKDVPRAQANGSKQPPPTPPKTAKTADDYSDL
jgi:hypothetical protein